jgi:hypothetical protein
LGLDKKMGCLKLTYEETPTLFLEERPEKIDTVGLQVWVNPDATFEGVEIKSQNGGEPGLGFAGTLAIPLGGAGGTALALSEAIPAVGAALLAGYTVDALERRLSEKTYVTYTKRSPDGRVYVGRTSGYGNPQDLVAARDAQHKALNAAGFFPAQVDRFATGLLGPQIGMGFGFSFSAYAAIRGREQQLIDSFGGVGSPGVANAIRGVSPYNPLGRLYQGASDLAFGPLAPYTGY